VHHAGYLADQGVKIVKGNRATMVDIWDSDCTLDYCTASPLTRLKHGVGFMVARQSTHYGIAGYYTGMAADQGCVGSRNNFARDIAATFGRTMLRQIICFGIPSE
jgi:LDH2 family malate/lactate/ureidoglycolate dehydrogenase